MARKRPVQGRNLALGLEIGEERESQVTILGKGCVAPATVHGDPKDLCIEPLKLWKDLIVQSHLVCAHRTPVSRIKGEDHRAAAKIAQTHRLIGRAVQGKVRGLLSRR